MKGLAFGDGGKYLQCQGTGPKDKEQTLKIYKDECRTRLADGTGVEGIHWAFDEQTGEPSEGGTLILPGDGRETQRCEITLRQDHEGEWELALVHLLVEKDGEGQEDVRVRRKTLA